MLLALALRQRDTRGSGRDSMLLGLGSGQRLYLLLPEISTKITQYDLHLTLAQNGYLVCAPQRCMEGHIGAQCLPAAACTGGVAGCRQQAARG